MRILILMLMFILTCGNAGAFCGFYVAKADTRLFNKASKVVLVRDANRTVLTMANDYQGEMKEFAIVIPVPTVLKKEQIHVSKQAVIDHLDAYTAPRLVEYFDPDPCRIMDKQKRVPMPAMAPRSRAAEKERNKALGVTIEAQYTVGEYDILILSAKQSNGLQTWLKENSYKIPRGAGKVLASYIKQGMKFFVAKVNLKEQNKLGFNYLRPLAMAFESKKFMLPIRLGTVNADGPQELFIFALTRNGRVETTNYRTIKLPSNTEVPVFVKKDFGNFYRAMFKKQVDKENMRVVFLEYAWDMNWCDPCAANPLSNDELRELGVFWLNRGDNGGPGVLPRRRPMPNAKNVFVTRLHLRYTAKSFPDDLRFQSTANRQNFQGRYIIRHPWKGDASRCGAARNYFTRLNERMEREAGNLSNLTGWDINDIRSKMDFVKTGAGSDNGGGNGSWWKGLWK